MSFSVSLGWVIPLYLIREYSLGNICSMGGSQVCNKSCNKSNNTVTELRAEVSGFLCSPRADPAWDEQD